MKKAFVILFSVLSICQSCIYDYVPEVQDTKPVVVIEGDIILGSVCTFSATASIPLKVEVTQFGAVRYVQTSPVSCHASFTVQDDTGKKYVSAIGSDGCTIDLRDADDSHEYRLIANVSFWDNSGQYKYLTYVTDYMASEKAPEVGEIRVNADSLKSGRAVLMLNLSAENSSGCYRWDYEELYRFHAPLIAPTMEFLPESATFIDHSELPNPQWWDYTWCWRTISSKTAGLAIARAYEGWELKDHEFLNLSSGDLRFQNGLDGQSRYYIRLTARTISEECYRYMEAVNRGSDAMGSLLSPAPSEIVGNIYNIDDPNDRAIGYVSVCKPVTVTRRVNYNTFARYDRPTLYIYDPMGYLDGYPTVEELFRQEYLRGNRPYDAQTSWVPLRCIDCRESYGTLEVPEGWDITD